MTSSSDDDEHTDVWHERFDAALEIGLTNPQARRFANGQESVHTLQKLKRDGCDLATIVRIVC